MRSQVNEVEYPKEAAWKHVLNVRVARPTPSLSTLAVFYQCVIGLHLASAFSGHAGFDGTIFRTTAEGPEWELTQGPHDDAALSAPRTGWELNWAGATGNLTDPDGFNAAVRPRRVSSNDVVFSRHTHKLRECANFYDDILGWPCVASTDKGNLRSISVTLPGGQGSLRLYESAHPVPGPTVEDLLVLYFSTDAPRAALVKMLVDASAPVLKPHNPWWHERAVCFADPDGFGLALAC